MVKVNPTYKEYIKPSSTPMIVLNTSCQIVSLNDHAAHLLQLKDNDVLNLDKSSQVVWNRLVKQLSQDEYYHCVLNLNLKESIEKFHFVCHFDRKKELIYARIKKHTNYNININKKFAQLHSMFKDFPNGLVISEIEGNIIDLNENAANMLGREKCQLINNKHENIFNEFVNENIKFQYFWELTCNGQATIEISRKINDCIKWYKLESKINHSQKVIYTTITDETEKYLLKQKLDFQNNLAMVGQLAATTVHEIRNPMTSINGFIDLLKLNTTEDNMKYLSIMKSELERMDVLLSELLNLSKPVERSFESISFTKVINEVEEMMKPLAALHNVKLLVDLNEPQNTAMLGNANRIKQMLINLVKNAIEEMLIGGTITLKLKVLDKIQIAVSDEGRGIEEEQISKLFTSFYTTKPGGTGLGLQLVKQVVEEHNGCIHVKSIVNEGTTFIVEFPIINTNSQEKNNKMKS